MTPKQVQKLVSGLYVAVLVVMLAIIGSSCLSMVMVSAYTAINTEYHTVKFSYNGQIVNTQVVANGNCAQEPNHTCDNVVVDGETYYFSGWTLDGQTVTDLSATPVTKDTLYGALFTRNDFEPMQLYSQNMPGLTNFLGDMMWYDLDGNVYYSYGENQLALAEHDFWDKQTWQGLTDFNGDMVWNDGVRIYYSNGTAQYVLTNNHTWQKCDWQNLHHFYGAYIWQNGGTYYYSYGQLQYCLAKGSQTWQVQTWQGLTEFDGRYVWNDGANVYYSKGEEQYILDGTHWQKQQWVHLSVINGCDIWSDGTNCYYSSECSETIYRKSGNQWVQETFQWVDLVVAFPEKFNYEIIGQYVWHNRENVYYSSGRNTYQIFTNLHEIKYQQWQQVTFLDPYKITTYHQKTYYYFYPSNTYGVLVQGTWNLIGLNRDIPNLYLEHVWCVGDQIYYSYETKHFVWNSDTSSWIEKQWNQLNNFYGKRVWSVNQRVYYSNCSKHYYLDTATDTWVEMQWKGLENFSAEDLWQTRDSNGVNHVYHSVGNQQYELDIETNTWREKIWYGLTNFDAENVWIDGEMVYYSAGEQQYVLDQTTSTWHEKTWHGLDKFYGRFIWHDGEEHVYYSNYNQQYQLVINEIYAPEFAK